MLMAFEYSQESRKALDAMRAEYPELRSVLIPALKLAQKDHGSLTKETIVPEGSVLEVTLQTVA